MAPVETNDDYYAVLEIPNTATLEVVNKSYRRLAMIRHPDKNLHNKESTAAFQLVSPTTFCIDYEKQIQGLNPVDEAPQRL